MAKVQIDSVSGLIAKAGDIRKKLVLSAHKVGGTHIGGPLSATDMTVALYYKYLGFDPDNLDDPDRNMYLLSKGHCGILLYTIFCEMGMYDFEELFTTYNKIGGIFGPHPNRKHVKGIEISSGSLGHGLSWAAGIAHANRNENRTAKTYVMLGDGEMEEGSNWEAALYIASKHLDSVVAIVDFNHCSASFLTGENLKWDNKTMADAWRAFGWNAIEIDGSNMQEIDKTLASLPKVDLENPGKPTVIISYTTKGQGVEYMEAMPQAWHIGGLDEEKLKETHSIIDAYTAERMKEVE